jgi:UV excision repair protein RAD23
LAPSEAISSVPAQAAQSEQPNPNPTTTGQSGYVNLFAPPQTQTNNPPPPPQNSTSLEFLRTNPQFIQLRQMVQNQPNLLQPLLQEISQNNPELIQLIQQNQDQFFQMLNEGDDGNPVGGENVIRITEEDNQAIERVINSYVALPTWISKKSCY